MRAVLTLLLLLVASPAIAQVGLPWPGPGGVASAAAPGAGPFVLKCHSSGNTVASLTMATADVNCTGANTFFCEISRYTGNGSLTAMTDTSSNTYTQIGTEQVSSTTTGVSLWRSFSAATSASLHWGEITGTANFATMSCAGFSDGSASTVDQTAQAAANQPGSVTPSVDAELVVTAFVTHDPDSGTPTISAPFTVTDAQAMSAGTLEGGGLAYEIQTTATARNPTWSTTGGNTGASIIGTFK